MKRASPRKRDNSRLRGLKSKSPTEFRKEVRPMLEALELLRDVAVGILSAVLYDAAKAIAKRMKRK